MANANILITGASSGIGAALARRHAKPGIRLFLWGRDEARLEAVAADCRERGATCATASFDLADTARLAAEIGKAEQAAPLDLAILCAGLGGSLSSDRVGQAPEDTLAMCAVNFTAPVLAANLLADAMAGRGRGRIAFVGSVAAAFPLPMAPLYSGSKAGLAVFAEALRLRLSRFGVGVTVVLPGFVDTPMSRSLAEPRPFLISADAAAATIAAKIEAGADTVVLPWQFAAIRTAAGLLPRRLLLAILAVVGRHVAR